MHRNRVKSNSSKKFIRIISQAKSIANAAAHTSMIRINKQKVAKRRAILLGPLLPLYQSGRAFLLIIIRKSKTPSNAKKRNRGNLIS